jgi:cytochrome c biogenesis protein CcdA
MPLSDHEQRMLDQIESALYAEDPKFASSVRGGTLRAPSTRRRLQGAALFVIGLAMLVSGVAFKATMIGSFPILSVVGFIVMFAGVVFAITGPRVAGGARDRAQNDAGPARQKRLKGGGGSFTSRMEDRFRRRFDE